MNLQYQYGEHMSLGYKTTTGEYKVPYDGLYFFSTTVGVYKGNELNFRLVHGKQEKEKMNSNGVKQYHRYKRKELVKGYSGSGSGDFSVFTTIQAVAYCEQREVVFVEIRGKTGRIMDGNYNTFSGFLITKSF